MCAEKYGLNDIQIVRDFHMENFNWNVIYGETSAHSLIGNQKQWWYLEFFLGRTDLEVVDFSENLSMCQNAFHKFINRRVNCLFLYFFYDNREAKSLENPIINHSHPEHSFHMILHGILVETVPIERGSHISISKKYVYGRINK